jgi:hypothetical protein
MIAPLAAIPILAVVGVPQFAPVAASPGEDDDVNDLGEPAPRPPAPERAAPKRSADDLFAPMNNPQASGGNEEKTGRDGPSSRGKPERPRGLDWMPAPDALDGWEVDAGPAARSKGPDNSRRGTGDDRDQPATPNNRRIGATPSENEPGGSRRTSNGKVSIDEFDGGLLASRPRDKSSRGDDELEAPPAARPRTGEANSGWRPPKADDLTDDLAASLAAAAAEQSGWKAAAERLKELGIRKYRLESQIEAQKFLFTCTLTSPGSSRITRRFEADADNPLEAVEKVLEQVEEWRQRSDTVSSRENLDDDDS